MDAYEVKLDPTKIKLRHRAALALCTSACFFVLWFGWKILWPTPGERTMPLLSLLIESVLVSLIFGIAMAFFELLSPRRRPSYKLLVNEDSITGEWQYKGWMKWLVMRRTIRKGKVRTIFEIKPRLGSPGGVGISERTPVGARLWGFVYLSRTMPEYDQLRKLAQSWRNNDLAG